MNRRPPQKSSRKFTYIYRKVCTGNHKIILTLLFVLSTVVAAGQISLSANSLTPKPAFTRGSISTMINDSKLTNLPTSYREMLQTTSPSLQPAGVNGLQPVQKNHYVNNFAFFCRQELKLEKKLKIPVRLRVGSLEQCNKLEQKD